MFNKSNKKIMLFDKINPLYFLLAFTIGLLYCYITKPKPKIIMKFPSPINSGKITYKSDDGSCYKYKASKESCPMDKNIIKHQPIADMK
jgi:hypothetical protein